MVIDIILVVLFIVAAIWGAYKGAVKIIASLASFILAFVLAYTLAGTVGEYIKETSFGKVIEQAIETRILYEEDEEVDNITDNIISDENELYEAKGSDAVTKIEEVLGDKVDEVISENKEALSEKIVYYTFMGIGFLATFIGVKLVLFIVFLIIGLVFKLPLLKAFNKLTGSALEIVLMLLKVWIVLAVISFMAPLDFMQEIIEVLNESVITKALYDHNIVVSLIIGKII